MTFILFNIKRRSGYNNNIVFIEYRIENWPILDRKLMLGSELKYCIKQKRVSNANLQQYFGDNHIVNIETSRGYKNNIVYIEHSIEILSKRRS